MIVFLLSLLTASAAQSDAERAALVGADLEPAFHMVSEHRWRGGTILRFRPQVHDLVVHGHDVVVSVAPDLTVRRWNHRNRVAWPTPSPKVTAEQALVASGFDQAKHRWMWEPSASLEIQVDSRDQATLVWVVRAGLIDPLSTWEARIDAHTGKRIAIGPTHRTVDADIFPTNPEVSALERVELSRLFEDHLLSGDWTHVTSCVDPEIDPSPFGLNRCHVSEQLAVPDENGDFLFDVDPASHADPLAEVQTYFHLDLVAQWAADELGVVLEEPINGFVNFEYSNAFYGDFDGDGTADITLGTAPNGVDLAYDADVIYHEFGHGIVDRAADVGFVYGDEFGLQWADGSVNEGTADIIAMYLTGDPLMGEYAGLGFRDGPIRDLTEPRQCPEDLIGEVHTDGMVWASLGWQLLNDPAIGPDVGLDLVVASLVTWTAPLDWDVVGVSMRHAADDLLAVGGMEQAAYDAVIGHLEFSGIENCPRFITAEAFQSYSFYLLNYGLGDVLSSVPGGHQLSVAIDPDDNALRVEIADWSGADGMGYAVFLNGDEPVLHEQIGIDALGLGTAYPSDWDHLIEGTEPQVVVLDATTAPWLKPGGTVYVSVASTNLDLDLLDYQTGVIELAAGSDYLEPESAPGGCSCSANYGTPVNKLLFTMTLVGLVAARRKTFSFA